MFLEIGLNHETVYSHENVLYPSDWVISQVRHLRLPWQHIQHFNMRHDGKVWIWSLTYLVLYVNSVWLTPGRWVDDRHGWWRISHHCDYDCILAPRDQCKYSETDSVLVIYLLLVTRVSSARFLMFRRGSHQQQLETGLTVCHWSVAGTAAAELDMTGWWLLLDVTGHNLCVGASPASPLSPMLATTILIISAYLQIMKVFVK